MEYSIVGNELRPSESLDMRAILTCGQTFRFEQDGECWVVYALDKRCVVKKDGVIVSDDPKFFAEYFDFDTDYSMLCNKLSEYPELSDKVTKGRGIRILNQNLFEMIISFIISANNNIPRIKGIISRLCKFCGEKKDGYYAFPTPETLSKLKKEDFRMLGAGFRDRYLVSAADVLAHTDILYRLPSLSTDQARKLLLTLSGVGSKVADCIVLFGLRRWNCFPVDTWIFRSCSSDELDTPNKVREYYLNRYGEYAGLAQQYIFFDAREK